MSKVLTITVGVDEAGRGALAGPVVAAAVMLGAEHIAGLADSKKLSESRRAQLAPLIMEGCVAYSVGVATVEEIDEINILEATYVAMQRAVAGIVIVPDVVLVDGNSVPGFPYPARGIVGGDDQIPEIMAASILAKHSRDQTMYELDKQLPAYGFGKHKGYPTKAHIANLTKHGVSAEHRRTFGPVARLLAAPPQT